MSCHQHDTRCFLLWVKLRSLRSDASVHLKACMYALGCCVAKVLPQPANTSVVVERTLSERHDKAHRENGFIYFHKVPGGPPTPPDAKSLTEPTPFEEPAPADGWEATVWNAAKVPVRAAKPAKGDAKPDKDDDVRFSPFDPEQSRKPTQNGGGCLIS
eukprot:TRINITY_DN11194_c0_g1_i3.p1 TRINITY_DN11194_c0_g1~~TRINITY_DN11194_c0_g1_i3.p1  ORF type:complete len:158 (+),score=10.17 TRINITY_DN11194_c0_g1_i3:102-575(+)